MVLAAGDPGEYLGEDDVVDWSDHRVGLRADALRRAHRDDVAYAVAAFEYVRDGIAHSWDVQDPRVTVSASETLAAGVGLCYAKSHLLAALLRRHGIPAGLCYQRLTDDGRTHALHGLVAVHLNGSWHRQDPRGNKPGVDARFSLAGEHLAWPVRPELGERDYAEVFVHAHPGVVATLRQADDVLALCSGGLPSDL